MSYLERLGLGAILLVLALATLFAVRVGAHSRTSMVELGRAKLTDLEPRTRQAIEGLGDDVLVTYYVTARPDMPSHLRRLERSVTDVLEAFASASAGRFTYQIVDPGARPDLVGYAAGQRVAPFHVRSVQHDAYSEARIYSTLTIAYGIHPPALVPGVLPEHLPRLQKMLVEHLEEMETPRSPVFALAADSERYQALAADLGASGELRWVDPTTEPLASDVDVLFWMDPGSTDARTLSHLRGFLDDGGSAVVFGSQRAIVADDDASRVRFAPTDFDADALLGAFGLRPQPGLVFDGRCELVEIDGENVPAPHRVHCIAPNQDFHTLIGQPNGHLYFQAPTPPTIDGDLPQQLGWKPEVLATTSERTWTLPAADTAFELRELSADAGERAPKLPLLTLLRPVDPWRGSIVFGASSSPFADGSFDASGTAHRALLRVLTRTLASPDRLVTRRAGVARVEPLPPLSPGTRLFWRAFCLILVPAGLLCFAWRRGALGAERGTKSAGSGLARACLRPALVALVLLAGVGALGRAGWRSDVTADGLNQLAPATAELAQRVGERGGLTARLWVSSPDRLPPSMRPGVRALRNQLRDLDRAGADLSLLARDPADLTEQERTGLLAAGIEPFRVQSRDEETTTVRTVWSALELELHGAHVTLAFRGEESFEHLELRLAFALWRLLEARDLHVAFATDVPRLSPAEAHEDYQLKGRFAPSGTDVYSSARAVLEDLDVRVTHVDPQNPDLPADADLLIWIQPRRDVTRMLQAAVTFLRTGRPMALFVQHFNIQPRQYPGADFDTVYWPQPQSPDVERIYWPEVGIRLVRDVLFDERNFPLAIETHVNRDADQRDYEEQHSALPFLIRAAAANFAPDSNLTRGLGDLGFVWGAYLDWDEELLAQHDLVATPLVTTTERSWAYTWSGGWLPPDSLEGPVDAEGSALGPGEGYLGKLPLAALFEGRFPRYLAPDPATGEVPDAGPETPGDPSRLLFVGNSEMLQNHRLLDDELRADHLLVNAVFELGTGDVLSSIASRRRVPRGFDWVEPEARLRWRAWIVAAGPLALVLFGLLRWRVRG